MSFDSQCRRITGMVKNIKQSESYPTFYTDYRYRRKAEEYAERIIKEAGCKTQHDMAYVFAKECLEFAVGLLKISRKYPSGTDGKELLEQRSTLMANTCLIQELLRQG